MSEYTFEEYYDVVMSDVSAISQLNGGNPEIEFLRKCLEVMEDNGEFDDFEVIEDGIDAAGKWKINGFTFTSFNTCLCCFISEFESSITPKNFINSDIKRLVKKIHNFITKVLEVDLFSYFEPTSEVFFAAQSIKEGFEALSKIEIFVITNKPVSKRIISVEVDKIEGKDTQVNIWDINRFFQLELSGREREPMVLEFTDSPVRCLVTSESNDETLSLLAVVPGQVLFDIYNKWQARLLEQNVRTYLQNRSKVNKGIRHTIKEEPEKFFAYNNGLTTTAEQIEFVDENKTAIKSLNNFQIVNGAQTTSSIFAAAIQDKADISKISVQMKLTVVPPEQVESLVPKISRYANSQNKVSDADFFSNHPFHVEFEKMSRRIMVPPKQGETFNTYWFYERTRGQYLDKQAYLTKSEKTKFQRQHPRNQMLTKTELAKFQNVWRCKPNAVSKGAQFNFLEFAKSIESEWDKNSTTFNEFFFKKCVVHALVYKAMEQPVQKADWYSGFRANVIIYSLAYFSNWLSTNKLSLNYDLLFKTQIIPSALVNEVIIIAEVVNQHLQGVTGNLTTYAKGSSAWPAIMKLDININADKLGDGIASASDIKEKERESKKVRRTDTGLQNEMKLHNVTPNDWIRIKTFLGNMELLTPKYAGLIEKASRSPGATFSMTNAQQKVLITLLAKYEDEYEKVSDSSF